MPKGGTVPKTQNGPTLKSSPSAGAGDQSPSEEAVLRLGRLIGRQIARDSIRDRQYDALEEQSFQIRQERPRSTSMEG